MAGCPARCVLPDGHSLGIGMKRFRHFLGSLLCWGLWVFTGHGQVVISEFLASNGRGLLDSDGDRPDWIELHNIGTTAVDLLGWSLTDNAALPRKWVFPSVTLPAGGYRVVFASGKNRTNAAAALHTSFSLSVDGEYLGLFAPEETVAATEFAPAYPPQRPDISYGMRAGQLYYFNPPSPNAANVGGLADFVAETRFTRDRGLYEEPFDLEIRCDTADAVIRYTTNGAIPTLTLGMTYGGPIQIDHSTVIRAAAFKAGLQSSVVDTHTYLFLGDVIRQQPNGQVPWPEWPAPGSQSQQYDYGLDPQIVDSTTYRDQIVPALKALPSFSVVTALSNLFHVQTGIYSNPGQDGRPWERPCSLELLYPDGTEGFQINCGIRIRGGFSRSTANPKHAFRLFFRSEYGESKLRYPLHEGGVEEFDALDLRTFQNYSWSFDPGNGANGVFIRDVFSRDTQIAMGHPGERGNYYHLYINGVYWGIFNSCERPEANFGEAYFGGVADNYDVVKVEAGPYTINATDGNLQAWTRLYNLCRGITLANADERFWRVQGRDPDGALNPGLENLLDVEHLIDYMLVIVFGGNLDAPISNFLGNTRPNNWYGLRDRSGTNGGFRFIAHDAEHTLLNLNENRLGPYPSGSDSVVYSNPQYLWQQLWRSPEFRLRIADRVQKHYFNGGVLTPQSTRARFAARTNQLYLAVVAESARWGDSKRPNPLTRDGNWLPAANNILNNYLPHRTGTNLLQLRAAGLLQRLTAPVLGRHGGLVPSGFPLALGGAGDGSILYTLNGTDPRSVGGVVHPGALVHGAPVPISNAVRLMARVRRLSGGTNEWSALTDVLFHVEQDFSGLQVSEIHYAPGVPVPAGEWGAEEYEFLELKNAGATALDLSGVRVTGGIEYEFPLGTILEPGGFWVLAENAAAFSERYPGRAPDGVFTGRLSNSGERVAILGVDGTVVLEVTYGTAAPWPPAARGLGFSLVPIDPVRNPAPSAGTSWRASSTVHGSPGTDDPVPGIVSVWVNEVIANTARPQVDVVELYNPHDQPAPVGGWFLTDDGSNPRKYRIPDGTVIRPGGYLVFNEDHFAAVSQGTNAFRFSAQGDEAFLFSADGAGNLTGYLDGGVFSASPDDAGIIRHVNSVGAVEYVLAVAPTPGGMNSGPAIGPVVFQEIHPVPGPGELSFVEIRNITGQPQPLFDPEHPENTWQLGGLEFSFPPGVVLPPDGYALVTESDAAVFRARFGIPASIPVFGPVPGRLQAAGERLDLRRPDRPRFIEDADGEESVEVDYILVDRVRFSLAPPWPAGVGSGGVSLERRIPVTYGNDPASWRAATGGPSPGSAAEGNRSPRVEAGPNQSLTAQAFPLAVVVAGSATDDGLPVVPGVLSVQWQQVSGPPGVVFRNPGSSNGMVDLPGQGAFGLRMTVSDGERATSDDVLLTVERGGTKGTLMSFGSVWRYFDQRVNLGTTWRQPGFNDSSWASGRARLGYGGDGEVTTINGGTASDRIPTAYFRGRFNVVDPRVISALTVRLIRDDGGVVYLNGVEVMRVGMPEGIISFSTFANTVIGGAEETTPADAGVSPARLVAGENVLAVEIHQANSTSSDLGFDLALEAVVIGLNQAPTVDAGMAGEVTLPARAMLRAAFTDDGLPQPPGAPVFEWSRVSGPGTVTFMTPGSPMTEATFGVAGTYVLGFSAADGEFTVSDTVTVQVLPGETVAPLLSAIAGDPVSLRFEAASGAAYTLRYSLELEAGDWQVLVEVPAGAARVVEVPDAAADEQRFYQVILR